MPETTPPPVPAPENRALFITHHVPDMENVSIAQFEKVVPELRKLGFTKHRFDIRWNTSMPKAGEVNNTYLGKSALLAQAAHRQGLEPIVILSTPPKWAYRGKTSEELKQAYVAYAKEVKRHFDRLNVPIQSVQLLNEINNPVYTPKRFIEEMPVLAHATREVFGADTDVSATIVLAKPIIRGEGFLKKYADKLQSLNTIGLDFYPGSYQYNRKVISPKGTATIARQTLETIAAKGANNARKDFVDLFADQATDTTKLRSLLQTTKTLLPNAAIDIGEFGFPSLDPMQRKNPNHEKFQTVMVEKIVNAMAPVLNEYQVRNVGFYELYDDKELGVLNWGIVNDQGESKHIMEKLPTILQTLQGPELTP